MAKPRLNKKNLSKNKETKKRRRKYPNVFFKNEMVALFDNIDDIKIMVGSFLTFFCALRISEMCTLKWRDIDLVNGRVKIIDGKGGKDGFVKMSRDCTHIIKKWRMMNPDEEYFLPSDLAGYPYLHPNVVLRRFKIALKATNLDIPTEKNSAGNQQHQYKFHTLRHSRCTHLLNNGVPIHKVQHFMRHDNVDTTINYTWITNPELDEMVERVDSRQDNFEDRVDIESMTTPKISPQPSKFNAPIEIIKRRLAYGEITRREFKKTIELLQTPKFTSEN